MLPEPIVALTAALARLPGIGPRSAERLALLLVQSDPRRCASSPTPCWRRANASAFAKSAAR